jgi:septal ring factor EnvC (AmiA/AmiB activator)
VKVGVTLDTLTIGLIGLICTIIGATTAILKQKRNFKQDVSHEAGNLAKVETKIDYISKGVDDIRIDIKAQDRKIIDISERLIRVEESTKSAHKRLDALEKGE